MTEPLERYKQEATAAATYMDLKARHFGAFLIVNGLLLAGAFQIDSVARLRFAVSVLGIAVTLVFLRIDLRTGTYLQGHLKRSEGALQEIVGKDYQPAAPDAWFGVSTMSTVLYVVVVAVWLGIALVSKDVVRVPRVLCDVVPSAAPATPARPTVKRPASPVTQQPQPPPVRFGC